MAGRAHTIALIESAIAGAHPSSNGWYRADCPVCPIRVGKTDARRSLAFNPETGKYRCLRCEVYGKIRGSFRSLVDANPAKPQPDAPQRMDVPEGFIELGRGPGRVAFYTEFAREWLQGRGVDTALCAAAHIGVCTTGRFHNRVVIPVTDPKDPDIWLGYVGRTLVDREPRYLYPTGMQRGKLLFNGAQVHRDTEDPIVLVEGAFDVLPHFDIAVGCLGKPTNSQLDILCQTKRPIVVCLDGDAWLEGLAVSRELALELGKPVAAIRLPPTRDPGNLRHGTLLHFAREALASEEQPYIAEAA